MNGLVTNNLIQNPDQMREEVRTIHEQLEQSISEMPVEGDVVAEPGAGSLVIEGVAPIAVIQPAIPSTWGGVDISWGAELHSNELYGAIVANSYALESDIAQYPRVVVGDRVLKYFEAAIAQPEPSSYADEVNKGLAEFCKKMLIRDLDGYLVLDYLSPIMTESIGEDVSEKMLELALKFAHNQYDLYRGRKRNSKLAARYNWLVSYLENRNTDAA